MAGREARGQVAGKPGQPVGLSGCCSCLWGCEPGGRRSGPGSCHVSEMRVLVALAGRGNCADCKGTRRFSRHHAPQTPPCGAPTPRPCGGLTSPWQFVPGDLCPASVSPPDGVNKEMPLWG